MKKSFTLIELLVIMAIIAILAATLLPALNSTRCKAKQIGCINNEKQCMYGMQQYVTDSNGFFICCQHPLASAGVNVGQNVYRDGSYVALKMFQCPEVLDPLEGFHLKDFRQIRIGCNPWDDEFVFYLCNVKLLY